VAAGRDGRSDARLALIRDHVTAGVYMTARSFPIYTNAPEAMHAIAVIGIATAFFAATIGLAQNDIKKVFAYSTVSQLGYMFVGVGVGAFSAGVYHLMTHAFVKALLFLGAGSVVHALSASRTPERGHLVRPGGPS
jgi:NADH-quinone oxidoreductase subunit L